MHDTSSSVRFLHNQVEWCECDNNSPAKQDKMERMMVNRSIEFVRARMYCRSCIEEKLMLIVYSYHGTSTFATQFQQEQMNKQWWIKDQRSTNLSHTYLDGHCSANDGDYEHHGQVDNLHAHEVNHRSQGCLSNDSTMMYHDYVLWDYFPFHT